MRSRVTLLAAALFLLSSVAPASVGALTSVGLAPVPSTAYTDPSGGSSADWTWMRSASFADTATWTFDVDPAQLTAGTKNLYLYVTPLVTQAVNGGAGWRTRVKLSIAYTAGGTTTTIRKSVSLVNPFPLLTTAHSLGVGYQAYGATYLTRGQLNRGAGTIAVTLTRDPSYVLFGYKPHVAVKADSLQAFRYAAP
jgi:hypothetical protein